MLSNEKGSIQQAVIISVLLLALGLSLLTMLNSASHQTSHTLARIEMVKLVDEISASFRSANICACNIAPSNLTGGGTPVLNTTTPSATELTLRQLRATCDFASDYNVLGMIGEARRHGLILDDLRLTDVTSTGIPNIYEGKIVLNGRTRSMALKPFSVPVSINVDLTAGSATARPIRSCVTKTAAKNPFGIQTCPAGYTLVGEQGAPGNFCIEIDDRPESDRETAAATCYSLQYDELGRAGVCSVVDWYLACKTNTVVRDMTNGPEWAAGRVRTIPPPGSTYINMTGGSSTVGMVNCESDGGYAENYNFRFRCCITN